VLIDSAQHDALVQGLRVGATDVQFSEEPRRWPSGTFGGGQGVTVVGIAYHCAAPSAAVGTASLVVGSPPPAQPAAPPPAGCGKDTDCKGDRICQAGVCTDPAHTAGP
jgi:hypothetical protein